MLKQTELEEEIYKWLMDHKTNTEPNISAVIKRLIHPDHNDVIAMMNRCTTTSFVCFNCGNEFEDIWKSEDQPIAVLRLDPGSSNYPVAPDEPASFYFECIKCYESKQKIKRVVVKFDELCKTLEEQGKKFDAESLRLLRYGELHLAGYGNAGTAICEYQLIEQEQERRLKEVRNLTFEQVETDKGKWLLLDDYSMYFAWYQKKAKFLLKESVPKWRLLVEAMRDLRSNWSEGRNSRYLKKIYALLPEVEVEGQVPLGWCKADRLNADQFDGNSNDGRIMRDGALHLSKDLADTFGLPQTVSGNMALSIGAQYTFREGYRGSYEELFRELLTPKQKIIYCTDI